MMICRIPAFASMRFGAASVGVGGGPPRAHSVLMGCTRLSTRSAHHASRRPRPKHSSPDTAACTRLSARFAHHAAGALAPSTLHLIWEQVATHGSNRGGGTQGPDGDVSGTDKGRRGPAGRELHTSVPSGPIFATRMIFNSAERMPLIIGGGLRTKFVPSVFPPGRLRTVRRSVHAMERAPGSGR